MVNDMYIVGSIVGLHGLKGELKVKADTDFDRFKVGTTLYLEEGTSMKPVQITSHRSHKGLDLITLDGQYDINLVSHLVGATLYTPHQNKDLNDGEYYYEELIGKTIITEQGDAIGVVHDIRELPHGILLEVMVHEKNVLIPFVKEFIKEVNDDTIIIHVIEGLL